MTEEKADQIIRCVKECWWRVVIIFLIPAFASIAVFSSWPWGAESPWVMLAAIGTMVATVSALFLANIGDRKAMTLRQEAAALHAPEAVVLIEEIINRMNRSAGSLQLALNPSGTMEQASTEKINSLIKGVDNTLRDIVQTYSPNQFSALTGLSNGAAHRAAYGLAGLKRISFGLKRSLSRGTVHKNGFLLNNPNLLILDIIEAEKYLAAAMRALDQVSSAYAPKPTDEETFGEWY
ncbi:MAG: hypothetical protein ACTJHW_04000 [Paenalcaligenes sp.]